MKFLTPCTLAMLVLPAVAAASSPTPSTSRPAPLPDFIGAAARVQPVYDGAEEVQTKALPLVSLERDRWFLRSTRGVLEAGLFAQPVAALRIGALVAYEAPRDPADEPALAGRGLPTFGTSASIGPFVEASYFVGPVPLTWTLRWRQHLDQDQGAQADVRLTAGLLATPRLRAAAYTQWTWASARSMQAEFGIDGAIAQRSGLAAYAPGSGTRHVAAGLIGAISVSPSWGLVGIAETRRLADRVSASPWVRDDSAFYGTLGVTYRF